MLSRCNACFQSRRLLHYSTVTSTNDSYSNYFVHSLGFSQQQALSISTRLYLRRRNWVIDSKFVENANAVVALFRNLGFDDTLIRNIVSKQPRLLASDIDKTLKPKFTALHDVDFSRSDVIRVISKRPEILFYGVESSILPTVQILGQVMGSIGNVIYTMERLSEKYFRNIAKSLLPNVTLLSSYEIPLEIIRKQLLHKPWYFARNPEVFKDRVIRDQKKRGSTRQPPTTDSYANYSYANYLVGSLGFSHQQALSISISLYLRRRNKGFDSRFVENANCVVALFHQLGFDDTLIRNIVSKQPRVLVSDIDKTLKPKFRALHDEEFSRGDVIRVISKRPEILFYGLESSILPTVHNLRQVMGSVGNVITTMERLSEPYFRNIAKSLLPNVTLLSSYEIPLELIRKQLLHKPWHIVRNPEVFKDRVIRDQKKRGSTRQPPTTDSYANYLVGSLGFSHQQALSISTSLYLRRGNKGFDSRFAENANTVVTLFHNLGFRETHIRKIVSKVPVLLASKVDKKLKPKIRLLQDEDFSQSDVIQVISSCPTILIYGLESTILPLIQILKQVTGSICNVISTMERLTGKHFCDLVKYLSPNVALLSSYGVPIELIRKHMLYQPGCYVQNPELFKDVVMRVEKNLGITQDSQKFLHGISLISGRRGETIYSKC